MSWDIYADSPGYPKYTVSDVTYAGLDFGNSVDDYFAFECSSGCFNVVYIDGISSITCRGPVDPSPGVYPGWEVHAYGTGGSTHYHVDNDTKEILESSLLAEDARVEFVTLEGYTVHFYTKNLKHVRFTEDDLLIPPPD